MTASKKFPVLLTFDIDGESLWLNRDRENMNRPVVMSQGRYGPTIGIYRILDILARHEVKATFFIPGWVAEQYPDMVVTIHEQGHDIANHGYLHEFPGRLTRDAEEEALLRGNEALKRITGVRPVGYRAPAWDVSAATFDLLVKHGFQYSSNMMDADGPYVHVMDGKATGLVELPVSWMLDDAAFGLYHLQLQSGKQWPTSPMFEMWTGEFEVLYREGGSFVLTLHPQVTGRPYRSQLLERFVQWLKENFEVRFVRACDLAAEVRSGEVRETRYGQKDVSA